MLIKQHILQRIVAGEVTLAFRRWKRPTVRVGGSLRTDVGVLAIDAVDIINLADITEQDARHAGHESLASLVNELEKYRAGTLYRVTLRFAGADPRVALRERDAITDEQWRKIQHRLARLDRAGRNGPWTVKMLKLIKKHPGLRATELAMKFKCEPDHLKTDVRKLKELGLTESLQPGYRLSPRGQVVLERL